MMIELVDAVEQQPEPPCAACSFRSQCQHQRLACEAFWYYVNEPMRVYPTKTPEQVPSADYYARVYEQKRKHGSGYRHITPGRAALIGGTPGTIREVARVHGVSLGTVSKIKARLRAAA